MIEGPALIRCARPEKTPRILPRCYYKQSMAPTFTIQGQWIGGTGKYSGLEGTFEIHHTPLKPLVEGVVQGIGKKIGSYKIKAM